MSGSAFPLLIALSLMQAAGPTSAGPLGTTRDDPFYTQHVEAGGIPILASARAPKQALTTARDIVDGMLAARPDIRRELVREGFRVAVMAADEQTLDIPEQRDWKKPGRDDPRLTRCERKHYDERIGSWTDRQYWNWRARGWVGC